MSEKRVTRDEMFAVVKSNIQEIVEGAKGIDIKETDSMRDFGADSLEIVEVVSRSMKDLKIKVPRTELSGGPEPEGPARPLREVRGRAAVVMPGARDPERRVVITGMGVMTPIGERVDDYFESLLAGRSAVTRWRAVDERCASRIGGDMSGFDLDAHLRGAGDAYPAALVQSARRLMRPTPLSGRITAPAAMQAFVDAGLPHASLPPERFGHVLAGHNVNSNYVYEGHKVYLEEPSTSIRSTASSPRIRTCCRSSRSS
jgi:acyl carrier protein